MKTFTNDDIRRWGACYDPNRYFTDNTQHTVLSILKDERISLDDRFWCVLREELIDPRTLRLFAVWCARQVQHLMKDRHGLKVLDVAEAFANGKATAAELAAAWDAAREAAWEAAWDAAREAAWEAAWAAAWDAAQAARAAAQAAGVTARAAARDAQVKRLIEMLEAA